MPQEFVFLYNLQSTGDNNFEIISSATLFTPASVTDGNGTLGLGDGDELMEGGESVVSLGTVVGTYVGHVDNEGLVFTTGTQVQMYSNVSYVTSSVVSVNVGQPLLVCFGAGTRIATPDGARMVETLTTDDTVITADGRTVPVKWVGRQTVVARFAGDRARPVRIAAGALGQGLPYSDLIVTADHALILDGLAIAAGALVNGTTITRDPAPERATYYHIETAAHDAILANGAPAETFVDYTTRRAFDNYASYVSLHGADRPIAELPLPRITSARLVPASLRRRIAGATAA